MRDFVDGVGGVVLDPAFRWDVRLGRRCSGGYGGGFEGMNVERGEFSSMEDWCAKCWAEFTKLDKEEKAIWEFLNKRKNTFIIQKQREQERPLILCENDGTLYESVHEAASVYNMTPAGVFSILRGNPDKKRGLVFSYYRK